ncbi:hypothetical protein BS78_02G121200 [Paspalum vaginatum]|nr:hypothetical protein BS78_02G121200 [Paspalum vaginatum]
MENPNSHSEHADQPQGPQANLPIRQVLDSHMIGQQHTNLSPFCASLEQRRLQLDQVLQLHNEQLRASLQQQISIQNTALLNLVESMTKEALVQKHDEIARLRLELQKKQDDLETTLHDREEWMQVAVAVYEMNQSLICMLPPAPQETNSHVSSNQLDAPGSGDDVSSMAREAVEITQPNLMCKVCNSGDACMLLLPCQHLCACKPCGFRLRSCPVCSAVKDDAIEARFG